MPRTLATGLITIATLAIGASWLEAQGQAGAEGRREDLAKFRAEFMARDRAYTAPARTEAEARLARLESSIEKVSQAYFDLELARIVALADNGHTAAFGAPRSRRYNRVPVRLVPFGEDFFVLRVDPANEDLLSAKLIAIDGRPIETLRTLARSLAGGTAAFRDRNAGFFFESPELLYALDAAKAKGAAVYRFAAESGRVIERRLAGEPPNPTRDAMNSNHWLYPESVDTTAGRWRPLLPPARAPWALQEPGVPFRWREAPELQAIVVEFRRNYNAPNRSIADFLKQMTAEIEARRPRNLVLDMRANGGGDLNTTRDFIKSLPNLVPGRIFVLTSPWTFSAAISSVGYLEQASPDRVSIVGEMAGDRLEFWAEGRVTELPNSGAMVLHATERHDYKDGCRAFTDCHGPVVRNPISVPSLAPDIPAPWTIEAYRAGRDPAIEAVATALRQVP